MADSLCAVCTQVCTIPFYLKSLKKYSTHSFPKKSDSDGTVPLLLHEISIFF